MSPLVASAPSSCRASLSSACLSADRYCFSVALSMASSSASAICCSPVSSAVCLKADPLWVRFVMRQLICFAVLCFSSPPLIFLGRECGGALITPVPRPSAYGRWGGGVIRFCFCSCLSFLCCWCVYPFLEFVYSLLQELCFCFWFCRLFCICYYEGAIVVRG